jgi:hypothetical protein
VGAQPSVVSAIAGPRIIVALTIWWLADVTHYATRETRCPARNQSDLAPPAGIEPATYRLEGGCSIR